MQFGLENAVIGKIKNVFAGQPEVKQAILYGSRVLGTFHEGSDLDITLTGADVNLDVIFAIQRKLDDLNLPYMFDLSVYRQINNADLRNHIERVGVVFYGAVDAVAPDWKECTIGAVCEVIAGQSPKSSNYNKEGIGLPFYQGKKEFGEKYIGSPTKWTTRVTSEAIAGDILLSVRAPVGPINFSTQHICIGRGLAVIRAGDKIHREFLFYQLLSMRDQIKGSEGAVFASINKTQIEDIKFLLPPLVEQKRIVVTLDKAFAEIARATANVEKILATFAELKQSLLCETFAGRLTDVEIVGRDLSGKTD